MLHTKTAPKGIDIYIQRFQTELYNKLTALWGQSIVYESYGRCYRNKDKDQYTAEVYTTKNEYSEVLWNDKASIVSFFGIEESIEKESRQNVGIHLVVFCNLKKLKPLLSGRADEEIKNDFRNLIGNALYGFHFKDSETGIENVLSEYKGSIAKMKNIDMHPIHSFRLNFSLSYNHNYSSTLKLN